MVVQEAPDSIRGPLRLRSLEGELVAEKRSDDDQIELLIDEERGVPDTLVLSATTSSARLIRDTKISSAAT